MTKKLFKDCNGGSDKKFYCLCSSFHQSNQDIRKFCEKLWLHFEPYADKQFLTAIKNDFPARFWEMYLYNAFLERGRQAIGINSQKGPDLLYSCAGQKIWVEAIYPKNGINQNKVDAIQYDIMQEIPEDKIILRLLSALSDKVTKYNGYIKSNIVDNDDCCIIALNGSGINMNDTPINIFKALFNIGHLYSSYEELYFKYEENIIKNEEIVIDKFFHCEKNKLISAILYSNAYATDNKKQLGYDFYLILNPNAVNPLPKSFYAWDIITKENVLKIVFGKEDK